MKRLAIIIGLLAMIGCASAPVVEQDHCTRLQTLVPVEETILRDLHEENQYMFSKGAELAALMARNPNTKQCIYMNIHMMHRNLTAIGEMCAEVKDDGSHWLCENSCDFQGGEVVKERINRCVDLGEGSR